MRRPRIFTALLTLFLSVLLAACAVPTPNPPPLPPPAASPEPAPAAAATTPPPPAPKLQLAQTGLLLNQPETAPGYILFNLRGDDTVYLIDRQGREVYRWELDGITLFARLLENGSLLVSGTDGRWNGGVRQIDPAGQTLWQYRHPAQHHDFLPLPNGNILLLSRQRKSPAQLIALGADPQNLPSQGLAAAHILEIQPTPPDGGQILWEWSAWDHLIQDFDPTKPHYGPVADHPERIDLNYNLAHAAHWRRPWDWQHSNSLAYNPQLDQIMLSIRHFSEIWILDHSTTTAAARGSTGGRSNRGGDLLYRWGNPRAWQAGTPADQQLFWHHNAHWIEPGRPGAGNILIFNNGSELPGQERGYSSLTEIVPPAAGYAYQRTPPAPYPPAQPLWTYQAQTPTDFYAPSRSSAQRLPNGNTLICDGVRGIIFEVTPAGKTVWKYRNPITHQTPVNPNDPARPTLDAPIATPSPPDNSLYRAYHYPSDYPGLRFLNLTPGKKLNPSP